MKELFIEYKTKTFPVIQDDAGTKRMAIRFKVRLAKSDCNFSPMDHEYYNSDLFVGMLNGRYNQILAGRSWAYVDDLPNGLTLNTEKFLAVVRIPLEKNFGRKDRKK